MLLKILTIAFLFLNVAYAAPVPSDNDNYDNPDGTKRSSGGYKYYLPKDSGETSEYQRYQSGPRPVFPPGEFPFYDEYHRGEKGKAKKDGSK